MKSISDATKDYPRFDDGRIDYTNERTCFVLNCVVVCGEKILLTKRGNDVIAYPNTLNGVSGFIDDTTITLEEQAKTELVEELQMPLDIVKSIKLSEPFIQVDEAINREWHVYAGLVELSQEFAPVVNWENKTAEWFAISDAQAMELMPGFPETLKVALALRSKLSN